jgi:uncharacterized membrane protein HdeD (DUF308 family)
MSLMSQIGVRVPKQISGGFRTIGIIFAVLGALAIMLPVVATVVIEQLIAWILIFWGVAGLMFAYNFRPLAEWRIVAMIFAAVLAAGLGFVVFPGAGASFLTIMLIIVFLLEGVISILLGLRMSGQLGGWGWIIFSGTCSFVLGLVILMQWPDTAKWVLGFLVGLNFLSTGLSLLLIARTARQVLPK